jgi:hypothetical protein
VAQLSVARDRLIVERKEIKMNKMINREKTYYTIEGDDLFRCCEEYQDREYCVSHDKFQGCAFCSSFAYWESCDKGIVCGSGE